MKMQPRDALRVWHSYAQMKHCPPPLPVRSAEGVYLTLENGRRMIDAVSSWWTVCHGHRHPAIMAAIEAQLQQVPHVMMAGMVHESAYHLAEALMAILPAGLRHFIYIESGSMAVETALKLACHYHSNRGESRHRFVYFRHGYHGESMGAALVSDDRTPLHQCAKRADNHLCVDIPRTQEDCDQLDALLAGYDDVAAMVVEPILQGAGGMRVHSAGQLEWIYGLAKKYGMLFIADEIATGFYRTGTPMACDQANITPDIMCLGKAITGGMMPFATVAVHEKLFDVFYSDDPRHTLRHGTTFAGNPLGCAAAIASLRLFATEPRESQVQSISAQLKQELELLLQHPRVKDVRVCGAMGALELDCTPQDITRLRARIAEGDVWLRPFGNVLYTMPPFIITESELHQVTATMAQLVGSL